MPANFALLERNAANCARIRALPYGLAAADAQIEMYASDDPANQGGYSRHAAGTDPQRPVRVALRSVAAVLEELGLEDADVIKVDTEGGEYEILTAFPPALLGRARYIAGELHGERDFALLDYLGRWFDIGARKTLGRRLFNFRAVPKRHARAQ